MKRRSRFESDRGLGAGTLLFIAMIIVGGLLFIAFNTPAIDMFDAITAYTSDSTAQDHVDTMETIWNGVLVFIMFLAVVFLVSRSIVESRGP